MAVMRTVFNALPVVTRDGTASTKPPELALRVVPVDVHGKKRKLPEARPMGKAKPGESKPNAKRARKRGKDKAAIIESSSESDTLRQINPNFSKGRFRVTL